MAGLAANFFVINTMDNKSGLINLSFTGDPEKYIDGGELHYVILDVDNPSDTVQSFDFPASRASMVYQIASQGAPVQVNQQLDLKGKMNLSVTELLPNRSRLTVNINYVLNLRESGGVDYHETLSFVSGQSAKSALDSVE